MLYSTIRKSRAELNTKLGPQALQLAHNNAVTVIHRERPNWTSVMVNSIGWEIIRRIDWGNPALMHKDFTWVVKQYLNLLCPQT